MNAPELESISFTWPVDILYITGLYCYLNALLAV